MSILSRLRQLEQLSAGKIKHLATVCFTDGTRRRMPAADIIPLFCDTQNRIVDVTGGGPGDGRLVELLSGLIDGGGEIDGTGR